MIAVNLADLAHPDLKWPVQLLLAPLVWGRQIVEVERGVIDGQAVLLDGCEGDDLKALCAVSILQRRALVRAYLRGPKGGWRRLPKLANKSFEELEELARKGGEK